MSVRIFLMLILFLAVAINSCTNKKNKVAQNTVSPPIVSESQTEVLKDREPPHVEHLNRFINFVQKQTSYELVYFKDWPVAYKTNIETESADDFSYYVEVSPARWAVFDGGFHQQKTVAFANTKTLSVVLKHKTTAALKPDIMLTQIYFADTAAALAAQTQMAQISEYILDDRGLKSPNQYWQHGQYVYLARVRAAAFDYTFLKTLYETQYSNNE